MTTAAERAAQAAEWDAEYEALSQDEGDLASVERACEFALIDMTSDPVLRVRAAIRRVATGDNPDPIMRSWAASWLKSTDGLIEQAQKMLTAKAARDLAAEQAAEAAETPDPQAE